MEHKDPSEIKKMVDARDKELKELKDRFEADYKLWRLTEFQLGESADEYDNYTTSWPRNKSDKITEILGYAPLAISIPQEDDDEKEREDKASAERLIYGCYHLGDERLRATIQPTIQEQLAFYAVNRGWVVKRIYIHAEEDGTVFPDIAIWDPLNVVWEVGPKGLEWVCHKRPITKAQGESEYNKNLGEKAVLYDYWDKEGFQVSCNGETLNEDTHDLDHVSIFIGMVGPAPFIQSGDFNDTIKDWGESIFASDRHLIPVMNKLKTFYLTIIGQGAHNPLVVSSAGGQKSLEKSPYRRGSDVRLDTEKGEKIEPLFKPVVPQDAAALVSLVQQELTMGGAVSILWGIDEAGGSGYRANLLQHAASTILLPRQTLIEQAYEWGAREILSQYQTGKFGKTRVRGRDANGKRFDTELSSGDIKGDWFPDAKLQPRLPYDETSMINMLKIAKDSGIFSTETAMEKAGVPDIELEKGRIWRERADAVPSVQVRKIMKELIDDGRTDIARQVWEEFQRSLAPKSGNGGTANPPSNVLSPAEYQGLTPEQQKDLNEAIMLGRLGLERGR